MHHHTVPTVLWFLASKELPQPKLQSLHYGTIAHVCQREMGVTRPVLQCTVSTAAHGTAAQRHTAQCRQYSSTRHSACLRGFMFMKSGRLDGGTYRLHIRDVGIQGSLHYTSVTLHYTTLHYTSVTLCYTTLHKTFCWLPKWVI